MRAIKAIKTFLTPLGVANAEVGALKPRFPPSTTKTPPVG